MIRSAVSKLVTRVDAAVWVAQYEAEERRSFYAGRARLAGEAAACVWLLCLRLLSGLLR